MCIDLISFYVMSFLTFGVFAYDKHQALFEKRRIPELVLLLLAFLGGAFGALVSMILFRHKTHKPLFLILVPLFTLLQVGMVILLRVFFYTPTIPDLFL